MLLLETRLSSFTSKFKLISLRSRHSNNLSSVYIDRMWWQWQQANASSRLYDMSGNSVNLTLASNIANEPVGGWPNTTLTYEIDVADILPSVDIATVMNIQGGCLCYQYDY